MQKVQQKVKKGKSVFTHRIDGCLLQPGDHIYALRSCGLYSHHGIYVEEDRVIHFMGTKVNDLSEQKQPCARCGYKKNVHHGVVKTCLKCFISDNKSLRLYQYEESSFLKKLKIPGTCSKLKSSPSETVVERANKLYNENNFQSYNLFENNCEHFATYCKTGVPRSEQVQSVMSIPMMEKLKNKVKNSIGPSSC